MPNLFSKAKNGIHPIRAQKFTSRCSVDSGSTIPGNNKVICSSLTLFLYPFSETSFPAPSWAKHEIQKRGRERKDLGFSSIWLCLNP